MTEHDSNTTPPGSEEQYQINVSKTTYEQFCAFCVLMGLDWDQGLRFFLDLVRSRIKADSFQPAAHQPQPTSLSQDFWGLQSTGEQTSIYDPTIDNPEFAKVTSQTDVNPF